MSAPRGTRVISRVAAGALSAVILLGASPAPEPAASAPDADTIFANVRRTWAAGAYPRYAQYATVVEFHKNGRHLKSSWDTIEDFRHNALYSRTFSREELARPAGKPGGVNISLPFFGTINKIQPKDPIGHVVFAVDQDYGLLSGDRRFFTAHSGGDLNAQASKLQNIGRTGTVARDYDVRLIETLGAADEPEFHLALTPLHDPDRLRLRELYVDGVTWRPEEAVVEGIGNRPPLTKTRWRVEYREIAGASYIARVSALGDVDYGKAGLLRWVTVSFDELHFTAKPAGLSQFGFGISDDDPVREP